MKNPKTTLLGIVTIAAAVLMATKSWMETGQIPDLGALVSALVSGVGLIAAADGKAKTSSAADVATKLLLVLLVPGFLFLAGCAGTGRLEYKDPQYGTAAFEWKAPDTAKIPDDKALQK